MLIWLNGFVCIQTLDWDRNHIFTDTLKCPTQAFKLNFFKALNVGYPSLLLCCYSYVLLNPNWKTGCSWRSHCNIVCVRLPFANCTAAALKWARGNPQCCGLTDQCSGQAQQMGEVNVALGRINQNNYDCPITFKILRNAEAVVSSVSDFAAVEVKR